MPIREQNIMTQSFGVWLYAPTSLYYPNNQRMVIANKDWLISTFKPNLTRIERITCE